MPPPSRPNRGPVATAPAGHWPYDPCDTEETATTWPGCSAPKRPAANACCVTTRRPSTPCGAVRAATDTRCPAERLVPHPARARRLAEPLPRIAPTAVAPTQRDGEPAPHGSPPGTTIVKTWRRPRPAATVTRPHRRHRPRSQHAGRRCRNCSTRPTPPSVPAPPLRAFDAPAARPRPAHTH